MDDLSNIPIEHLKGVGEKTRVLLAKLSIYTAQDLLFHLPLRYEDRTKLTPMNHLKPGHSAVVMGVVDVVNTERGRRPQLVCHIRDERGHLTLRFFHFTASQRNRLKEGMPLLCFGEVRWGKAGMEMAHPEYHVIAPDTLPTLPTTLTAIYPSTQGLQQRTWVKLTDQVFSLMKSGAGLEELLPEAVRQQHGLPSLSQALCYVHRPPKEATIAELLSGEHPMQQRLALEELVTHRLALLRVRALYQQNAAPVLSLSKKMLQQFSQGLGFTFTGAQQRVMEEIALDLAKPQPMLRLVQGDVGSGKTVVAAYALLAAVSSGFQCALMAPTEILAEQHYKNICQWVAAFDVKPVLLMGSLKAAERREAFAAIQSGEASIVIGTHALFQKDVTFNKLGLVVIDEQHRFGVHQRLSLRDKGKVMGMTPHQLIMTATPIPRTLAMSFYADLDCSTIDELPPGRKPIKTLVMSDQKRMEVVDKIHQFCAEGRQVYWVCPLIEASDVLQCRAAEDSYAQLKEALPELSVGLVHGRMKPAEKESVMLAFKQKEVQLLVATTVIEVGVDVPNACLMIIENAERLGLSQLHQLRGRVGRGRHESYCVLVYQAPLSQTAKQRLEIMRASQDGFVIAEKDLAIRGPGEVLGTRQTGEALLKIADLARDQGLLPQVQAIAGEVMAHYPERVSQLVYRWLADKVQFAEV